MGQRAEASSPWSTGRWRARRPAAAREFVAELFRLKGEFVLQGTDEQAHAAAETCFMAALTVAEGQGALFWQLRAAMSLARLKDIQGRRDDARQRLALVYGQFTEGFETADMLVAKRMLDLLDVATGVVVKHRNYRMAERQQIAYLAVSCVIGSTVARSHRDATRCLRRSPDSAAIGAPYHRERPGRSAPER